MNKYIEIKDFETDKVLKRFDVTGMGNRVIEKFENGININLNQDKFYTIKNETKNKLC